MKLYNGPHRAYFKETLQLHKEEKNLDQKINEKFLTTFFCHSLEFRNFRPSPNAFLLHLIQKLQSTTAHLNFLSTFSRHSLYISRFSALFSTLTLTKLQLHAAAQLTYYNCKLHFTTAQVVISCTVK